MQKKLWKNNPIEKIDAIFLHLNWTKYLPYSCLQIVILIIIYLKEKKRSFKSFCKLFLQPWPSTTLAKIPLEFLRLDRSFSWSHFSLVILGVSTFRRFLSVPCPSNLSLSFRKHLLEPWKCWLSLSFQAWQHGYVLNLRGGCQHVSRPGFGVKR